MEYRGVTAVSPVKTISHSSGKQWLRLYHMLDPLWGDHSGMTVCSPERHWMNKCKWSICHPTEVEGAPWAYGKGGHSTSASKLPLSHPQRYFWQAIKAVANAVMMIFHHTSIIRPPLYPSQCWKEEIPNLFTTNTCWLVFRKLGSRWFL